MMTSSDTFKAIRLRGSHAFLNFWTRPASTKPLAVLRIGVAGVLLFQAVALSGSVHALFGRNALISWNALQTVDADLEFAHGPLDLRHIAEWIRPLGITADETVTATYYLYIAGLVGLLLGIGTRFSSVLAFATHLLLTNSASRHDLRRRPICPYCAVLLLLDAGGSAIVRRPSHQTQLAECLDLGPHRTPRPAIAPGRDVSGNGTAQSGRPSMVER